MSQAAHQARPTVFVVDDDPLVLAFVSRVVSHNFDVLTATSGVDALSKLEGFEGTIDVLLSDFQMPEMSGVELATRVTALRPEVKVLLMSGFADGMLVLNEGWHFLAKPFLPSQLTTLIRSILGLTKHHSHDVGAE